MLNKIKPFDPLSDHNKAINTLKKNNIRPTKQRMILAKLLFDQGNTVMGYDKTKSPITEMLVSHGIEVVFEDSIEVMPEDFLKKSTQVIYTPAISKSHSQYNYFLKQGNSIKKRSVLLGELTKDSIVFAVAGTHGKTTTCALLIHLFDYTQLEFTAFLG